MIIEALDDLCGLDTPAGESADLRQLSRSEASAAEAGSEGQEGLQALQGLATCRCLAGTMLPASEQILGVVTASQRTYQGMPIRPSPAVTATEGNEALATTTTTRTTATTTAAAGTMTTAEGQTGAGSEGTHRTLRSLSIDSDDALSAAVEASLAGEILGTQDMMQAAAALQANASSSSAGTGHTGLEWTTSLILWTDRSVYRLSYVHHESHPEGSTTRLTDPSSLLQASLQEASAQAEAGALSNAIDIARTALGKVRQNALSLFHSLRLYLSPASKSPFLAITLTMQVPRGKASRLRRGLGTKLVHWLSADVANAAGGSSAGPGKDGSGGSEAIEEQRELREGRLGQFLKEHAQSDGYDAVAVVRFFLSQGRNERMLQVAHMNNITAMVSCTVQSAFTPLPLGEYSSCPRISFSH